MIKEAIEKIQELVTKGMVIHKDGGLIFANDGNGFYQLREDLDYPETITLSSLDAVVQMIKTEGIKRANSPIYVEAEKFNKVSVFVQPDCDIRNMRLCYYVANATDVPGWEPEVTMPFEKAAVALQTRFQPGGDRDYAIQLLSQITTGAHVTYNDTGIATTIVSSKGVSLQQNSTIKPIVKLRPYRTFQEVEQPEGNFLIRINDHGITFTEADGGMWKLTARRTVASYFVEALKEEIADGKVVVML